MSEINRILLVDHDANDVELELFWAVLNEPPPESLSRLEPEKPTEGK